MPKVVDHHERRTRIAAALLQVAADRGIEAVSLRHVATEAGVSSGMVQHYFRTKDEMMTFALAVVAENVMARMAGQPVAETPAAMIRALVIELLPFDEQRRIEGRVLLAFHAHATNNPTIAALLRENADQLRTYLAERIRTEQAAGTTTAALDAGHIATGLLALADGLGVNVLVEHYTADEALATFDAYLTAVLG
ncbi:TetR/AcrR family transcriptional regulator [Pseudonocardia sp. TRM90224]|uniref:TetR/AcrR family transcriptional regulator n=1 Tax=Pseudonocardia sp. TRM90224 TaxID=2812678 RepID=UPI001E5D3CFF|nr:TetR family transcriptional regulator C-terminal domain-containing protein [Pseudonocardia sp. TRM90224]